MNTILKVLINALFPKSCGLCNGKTELDDDGICLSCRNVLPVLSAADIRFDRRILKDCYIDEALAAFSYKEPIKGAVHRLKFYSNRQAGLCLAACMAKYIDPKAYSGIDFATAVPITKKRRRAIGYNHAEVLAKGFCDITVLSCRFDILIKTKEKPSQTAMKNPGERALNVQGIYEVFNDDFVKDKSILLIDDVLTTGSTLNECAASLKKTGARRVVCLTAAHPDI